MDSALAKIQSATSTTAIMSEEDMMAQARADVRSLRTCTKARRVRDQDAPLAAAAPGGAVAALVRVHAAGAALGLERSRRRLRNVGHEDKDAC